MAMPCNTAHYFHEDVKEAVSIPVLHMMDEVASLKGKVDQVGILASAGTLRTGLYEKALSAVGITAIAPGEDDQKRVMESIYLVKAGKLEPAREIILEQGKLLADRGAQAVIAGCTEIPLILKQGDLAVEVVDATDILAKACVRFACKD